MKTLPSLDKWTYIGSLSGGVDIKGYVQIKEEKEVKWKKGMFLMIEKDGLYVPFEVTDFYFKNDIPYVKLHLFPESAFQKWTHSKILIEKKHLKKSNKLNSIVGYEIYDSQSGNHIGQIIAIQEFSLNKILVVRNNENKEFFIPYHEEIITQKTNDKIFLRLPDGLLDLN